MLRVIAFCTTHTLSKTLEMTEFTITDPFAPTCFSDQNDSVLLLFCTKENLAVQCFHPRTWYPNFPVSQQQILKQGREDIFIIKSIHLLSLLSFWKMTAPRDSEIQPARGQNVWGLQAFLQCLLQGMSHQQPSRPPCSVGYDQRHSTDWNYMSNSDEKNPWKMRYSHHSYRWDYFPEQQKAKG